jgi:hypothetical protein
MFAPETSDPAAGADELPAGVPVTADGAPPVAGAAGVAGLELVHPATKTAVTTKTMAITLTCENFISILPFQLNSLQPHPIIWDRVMSG